MEIQKLYEKLNDQKFRHDMALANTTYHAPHVDQAKNVLYNNFGEIVEALKYAAEAEKQISVLEVEISAADAELKQKDDEIAELKKQKGKGKKANVEQGVQ